MAGHSKWANIQHRKAKQDAKRGKLFTKLIRALTIAARIGGPDPNANPRLRDAIIKAKSANMANDTLEKAIKKGAGTLEGVQLEEITYEGYGPGGVAVIVECLSDNRNRTVGEVRHAFNKCGGNLGTDGSVSYLFSKQGLLAFAVGVDEDQIMSIALDAGANDVVTNDDGSIDVFTTPDSFNAVETAMSANHLKPEHAEITMLASTYVNLSKDEAEKMIQLQDLLEDLDDVQNVYTNAEISDDIMESLNKI